MAAASQEPGQDAELAALADFVAGARRLVVITGAGVSTGSGIPDYRDASGAWKRRQPMQYQEFIGSDLARKRYWARSMAGWPAVAAARPNAAHFALAELQASGRVAALITQNVDGLHQHAGSHDVIDLHGRLDQLLCLDCGLRCSRQAFQIELEQKNTSWIQEVRSIAPDGDADLGNADFADFVVPPCGVCGGRLKPNVVFFGENVPQTRVAYARSRVLAADALLFVGTSLMVYSGYRFARLACEQKISMAAVNRGQTRADALLDLKCTGDCGDLLTRIASHIGCGRQGHGPHYG